MSSSVPSTDLPGEMVLDGKASNEIALRNKHSAPFAAAHDSANRAGETLCRYEPPTHAGTTPRSGGKKLHSVVGSRFSCRKPKLNHARPRSLHTARREAMHQTSLTESQKGVVRRYVEVWRRWRPGIRCFSELERDMENGSKVLVDGITVDDRSELPVISADT